MLASVSSRRQRMRRDRNSLLVRPGSFERQAGHSQYTTLRSVWNRKSGKVAHSQKPAPLEPDTLCCSARCIFRRHLDTQAEREGRFIALLGVIVIFLSSLLDHKPDTQPPADESDCRPANGIALSILHIDIGFCGVLDSELFQ